MLSIALFKGIKRAAVETSSIKPADNAEACDVFLSFLFLKGNTPMAAGLKIEARPNETTAENTAGFLLIFLRETPACGVSLGQSDPRLHQHKPPRECTQILPCAPVCFLGSPHTE